MKNSTFSTILSLRLLGRGIRLLTKLLSKIDQNYLLFIIVKMRVLVSISTTDPQKELHIKFTNKSSERLFNELYNDHLQMAQDVHNDEGCEEDNPVEDCPFERLIKYRRIFEQEDDTLLDKYHEELTKDIKRVPYLCWDFKPSDILFVDFVTSYDYIYYIRDIEEDEDFSILE